MDINTDMETLQNSIRGVNGASSYTIVDQATNTTLATFTNADISRLTQGGSYTPGTDATVRAMVNGQAVTLQRASNTIDMDGMSVTLKGDIGDVSAYKGTDATAIANADAANNANAVSFKTSGGSDDLVKTITGFVDEYNALLKELHDAYATQPAEKSAKNHTRYEPLSDDDKKDMSEKAIESYEAKAKQGLLFGDSDLRAAYESLVRAISPGGNDGAALRNIGIETTYSGGLTLIKLNESKLREKLDTDPDSVRNAFTKSKEGGASTDGLMTSIKNTLERYGSSSYSTPGILVKKAGSTHNATSLLNNEMQKQLDNVQKKIEQWQTKMSTKIDYYTRQFTALEKLMNTMNSQSSALAGLMGG
jgi:flagellar hook-associated protein 2